jgi:hypothetical protein
MKVSVQFQAPTDIPCRRIRRYAFGRRLGGPWSRSVRGGEDKKNPVLSENRTWHLPACKPITILTGIPARSVLSILYKQVFHSVLAAKNIMTKNTLTYIMPFIGCKYVFIRSSPTAERALIFENSHVSSACPSGESNLLIQMSVGHWWNQNRLGKTPVPVSLCQLQIAHGLTWY